MENTVNENLCRILVAAKFEFVVWVSNSPTGLAMSSECSCGFEGLGSLAMEFEWLLFGDFSLFLFNSCQN